jgi:hypothetical protein
VFAPNDFRAPSSPRPPIHNDRLIGALVLLILMILCLVTVLGMDRVLFIPFNATLAVTQTWQAQHPTTPGAQATGVGPRQRPTRSSSPNRDQQVRNPRDFSD